MSVVGRSVPAVAYDEDLAERIRDVLLGEPELGEQKMFGGLAFLLGGNMAVCASREGGILVRIDPAEREHLLATTAAFPMVMGGRTMKGFLRVEPDDLRTEEQLAAWVERGRSYARRLPAK
ncbi:TfoX-like protein [Pseudonocardia cypriaca]|uniref:TfoX-like protein n=1 Tax=Pseudonocardia cypriaca TaxID=882449 RepID=A0A543GBI5_9PSEU|nr:TfoX-like protein [Pseudonocardia cypriaca]